MTETAANPPTKPYNPQELALTCYFDERDAHGNLGRIHVTRKRLTAPGHTEAACGHPVADGYHFAFLRFIFDNAPVCPICRQRVDSVGLSNGT